MQYLRLLRLRWRFTGSVGPTLSTRPDDTGWRNSPTRLSTSSGTRFTCHLSLVSVAGTGFFILSGQRSHNPSGLSRTLQVRGGCCPCRWGVQVPHSCTLCTLRARARFTVSCQLAVTCALPRFRTSFTKGPLTGELLLHGPTATSASKSVTVSPSINDT